MIVLISCTKEKLDREEPARELYQGRLFLASVRYAEAIGARWFVLSAAHGLVDPDQPIAPYDVTLARLSSADRETWKSAVAVELKRCVPAEETLVVLAGREYAGWRDLVPHAVEEPLAGLPVGKRYARLVAMTPGSEADDAIGFLRDAVKHGAEALLPPAMCAALLDRVEAPVREAKRHLRGRDVPHVGTHHGRRKRKFGDEESGRRIAEKYFEANYEPKAPAIGFLYEDLAAQVERVPKKVFGQYPKTLIPGLLPWLRCERREILHVCSGSLPPCEGIRVDIRKDAHPDILADGRKLPLKSGSVAAVMLDPPYTEHYAKELYGVDYPRPSHLLREAARVVRHGGRIAFVHYITPNPPPGCRVVKVFGLSVGFGYPMRAVTIFERGSGFLPGIEDSDA